MIDPSYYISFAIYYAEYNKMHYFSFNWWENQRSHSLFECSFRSELSTILKSYEHDFDWFIAHDCIHFEHAARPVSKIYSHALRWPIPNRSLNALNATNHSDLTELMLKLCCFPWLVKRSEKPNVKSRQPKKNIFNNGNNEWHLCWKVHAKMMNGWQIYESKICYACGYGHRQWLCYDKWFSLQFCDFITSQSHASQFQLPQ